MNKRQNPSTPPHSLQESGLAVLNETELDAVAAGRRSHANSIDGATGNDVIRGTSDNWVFDRPAFPKLT